MFNKILVFGGFAGMAILVFQNMIISSTAYVLWMVSNTWFLAVISTIIGIAIGYGIKGLLTGTSNIDEDEDLNF